MEEKGSTAEALTRGGEPGIDRGDVLETALALDGLEKQIDGDFGPAAISVALEEITTGTRIAQAAEHSGGKVIFIGDPVAEIAVVGTGQSREGGLEKAVKDG